MAATPNVTFVMEQQVGLQTFADNLRRFIEPDPEVVSTWMPITYAGASNVVIEHAPPAARGVLTGWHQVRRALDVAPTDVRFFLTQVPAALGGREVARLPYVLMTDITPVQYDAMGAAYGHRADRRGLVRAAKFRLNRRLFREAAFVYGLSAWAVRSIVDDYGVDPRRVEVLAPGVDLVRWYPVPRADAAPMRVLFVGGDFARKGGATVLEACAALPDGFAELDLVTRTAVAPGRGVRVHRDLAPNSPELIALFQRSDVFVMPSHAEAFGQVVVEASAVGLPSIVTNVGGMPDIVEPEVTGFVVEPGDTEQLRSCLELLAADPGLRRRMGAAARARAEERFDARRNAASVVAKLLELTDGRAPLRQREPAWPRR